MASPKIVLHSVATAIVFIACARFTLHAQGSITLHSNKAEQRDWVWVKNSKGYWYIHADGTTYSITKGKMTWTFPGPSGNYSLKTRLYAKANGPAPCWVVVDGKTVWKGQTPLPAGQNFIYCCGNKNNRDCNKKKGSQGLVWVDTKTTVALKKGSKVEHWGQTAYHCQPSNWKPGTVMTQYGGGTYSGFAEMSWTPTDGSVTDSLPDPGPQPSEVDFAADHVKLSFGGPTGEWHDGDAFAQGGKPFTFSGAPLIDGIVDAAPADVYKSVRHNPDLAKSIGFLFPEVADGAYKLRFHVTDQYGGRAIDILAEGVKVIEDLDPVTAGGGEMKAVAREAAVTVADGNGLSVILTDDRPEPKDVFLSGLEIIVATAAGPVIEVLSPNGGESYSIGNIMNITWRGVTSVVNQVDLFISVNDGRSWIQINPNASIDDTDPEWGKYPWIIPPMLDGKALNNANALIKVAEYPDGQKNDISDKSFAIGNPVVSPVLPGRKARQVRSAGSRAYRPNGTVFSQEPKAAGPATGIVIRRGDGAFRRDAIQLIPGR